MGVQPGSCEQQDQHQKPKAGEIGPNKLKHGCWPNIRKAEAQTSSPKPFSGFGNIAFCSDAGIGCVPQLGVIQTKLKARARLEMITDLEHYSHDAVQLIKIPNREAKRAHHTRDGAQSGERSRGLHRCDTVPESEPPNLCSAWNSARSAMVLTLYRQNWSMERGLTLSMQPRAKTNIWCSFSESNPRRHGTQMPGSEKSRAIILRTLVGSRAH